MTKTLNQIIFFFLHQNQNIFFSNIGNQNIFLEKTITPPPLQVKWSFPYLNSEIGTFFLSCHSVGGVMVNVLTSRVVDGGFKPQLSKTKDYKSCICCFYAKRAALRSKKATNGWLRIKILCLI